MRRVLIATMIAAAMALLAGAGVAGCKIQENKDWCSQYMRCKGFDPKATGCKKTMDECIDAKSGDKFSSECMAKAAATLDAGIKRPADYCAELCSLCD
ncbi:MAG TPA: hypothetical protein VG389_13830 [Myxococcota bacterium]|nr:hypothetical protein [Myxococcota bacterium]